MQIFTDDLSSPKINALLQEHLESMAQYSPPESVHALNLEGLRAPELSFWTVWHNSELLGCGALKMLDTQHGEIKSMRTASQHLRKGVARAMLVHILEEAKRRAYTHLSLETGSHPAFFPAHRLYESMGFGFCGPFGDYVEDPYSVFMSKKL